MVEATPVLPLWLGFTGAPRCQRPHEWAYARHRDLKGLRAAPEGAARRGGISEACDIRHEEVRYSHHSKEEANNGYACILRSNRSEGVWVYPREKPDALARTSGSVRGHGLVSYRGPYEKSVFLDGLRDLLALLPGGTF